MSTIAFSRCTVKFHAKSFCSLETVFSKHAHICLATAYLDDSSTTLLNLTLPTRGVVASRTRCQRGAPNDLETDHQGYCQCRVFTHLRLRGPAPRPALNGTVPENWWGRYFVLLPGLFLFVVCARLASGNRLASGLGLTADCFFKVRDDQVPML